VASSRVRPALRSSLPLPRSDWEARSQDPEGHDVHAAHRLIEAQHRRDPWWPGVRASQKYKYCRFYRRPAKKTRSSHPSPLALTRLERVQKDGPHVAHSCFFLCIGQPLAVRRPRCLVDLLRSGEAVVKHFTALSSRYPRTQVEAFVGIRNLLLSGDHVDKEVRSWRAESDSLRLPLAILILDVQRVLARFVGEKSDLGTIRRPCRISLIRSGGVVKLRMSPFSAAPSEFLRAPRTRRANCRRNIGVTILLATFMYAGAIAANLP